MAEKERFSPPALGGISLLVVFAVLCLTVFALLTLTTVQADSRLGDSSLQAVTDYYAADCKAQKILALLRAGEMPEGVTKEGDYYQYTCPVSENQNLEVSVSLEGDTYEILYWRAVPVEKEQAEESLNVWDGITF